MMWLFNLFYSLTLNTKSLKKNKYIYYTNNIVYNITFTGPIKWKKFIFSSKYLYLKKIFLIMYETQIIFIKYIGKIYRLEKYKKKFRLLLHYPGRSYLLWKNIKLKWRRKKKRKYMLTVLTGRTFKKRFFFNLIKLRIPNTYTKRGIYNNIFIYYNRKRKITNRR